ncbi:MAG: pyridoxal phosphate-dependent aminotransferase [Lachnospiraceae bacterium]|nr:pyridoxal phosphate-dependent aminotransferase [Lachnospiraceae bacterium]
MNFDFDRIEDRRVTDSVKWNVPEDVLPMWVADMDFDTAPCVKEAVMRRAARGVFGYTEIPSEWSDSICRWWRTRHGLDMQPEWLVFCTGVLPALSSIVRKLTTPAEKVVVQTPVYNHFFSSILNNGRNVLENPLIYRDGAYFMDFEDLEAKLADPQTSLFILCNPHNPVGKIWDAGTLERIGELCARYRVTVVSDEIHCDLTDPGCSYVPFASVSPLCRSISITCLAPTKTFNLAGLQTAAVCVPDPFLRHKVWRGLNTDEVAEPNAFACVAATAAFREGGPWLDALRAYLYENKQMIRRRIAEEAPQLRVIGSEATYLLWIDCSALPGAERFAEFLKEEAGLYVSDGGIYGAPGRAFLRVNAAAPRSLCEEGARRLCEGARRFAQRAR